MQSINEAIHSNKAGLSFVDVYLTAEEMQQVKGPNATADWLYLGRWAPSNNSYGDNVSTTDLFDANGGSIGSIDQTRQPFFAVNSLNSGPETRRLMGILQASKHLFRMGLPVGLGGTTSAECYPGDVVSEITRSGYFQLEGLYGGQLAGGWEAALDSDVRSLPLRFNGRRLACSGYVDWSDQLFAPAGVLRFLDVPAMFLDHPSVQSYGTIHSLLHIDHTGVLQWVEDGDVVAIMRDLAANVNAVPYAGDTGPTFGVDDLNGHPALVFAGAESLVFSQAIMDVGPKVLAFMYGSAAGTLALASDAAGGDFSVSAGAGGVSITDSSGAAIAFGAAPPPANGIMVITEAADGSLTVTVNGTVVGSAATASAGLSFNGVRVGHDGTGFHTGQLGAFLAGTGVMEADRLANLVTFHRNAYGV